MAAAFLMSPLYSAEKNSSLKFVISYIQQNVFHKMLIKKFNIIRQNL